MGFGGTSKKEDSLKVEPFSGDFVVLIGGRRVCLGSGDVFSQSSAGLGEHQILDLKVSDYR